MIKVPKPRQKQPLTDERKHSLLCDAQFIGSIVQLVQNRWMNNMFDVNLNNQTMKNFANQIFRGSQGLKKELLSKFNLKNPEELEYDMATALDRVVSFFCLLDADLANKIMDGLEQGQQELIKKQKDDKD